MINRLLITGLASFAFAVSGHAENIVCPPQNEIGDGFGKWIDDYSGSLDEVSLSRQFLGEQEGAIIRCKREIGSMQIMFQKKSCRLIPEGGARSGGGADRWTATMIPLPAGVRVWLATGYTDMRKGFPSLALQVQEILHRDPLNGHLFCFRGRRGNLLKVIWHDGQGACLFTKRLERGRFIWPSPAEGVVTISSAQLGYLLSGIDWRHPQETWRPTSVG
jgi:transposase